MNEIEDRLVAAEPPLVNSPVSLRAPRSTIVDEAVTPWYHCISRCVRRAFLCGQGCEHRKQWIENRFKELVGVFAVECAGFAVMCA